MLVHLLCQKLAISPEMLAQITGYSVEQLGEWARTGVPLDYQFDFSLLEVMAEEFQQVGLKPHEAMRLPVAAAGGRTVLDLLQAEGPGAASFRRATEEVCREQRALCATEQEGDEVARARGRMQELLERVAAEGASRNVAAPPASQTLVEKTRSQPRRA